MREYNFIVREALQNGLAPYNAPKRNAPFMSTLQNLLPGSPARTPEWPTFPIDDVTLSGVWPWPQLTRDGQITILRDKTTLYEVDESDWSATEFTRRHSYDTTVPEEPLGGTLYTQNLLAAFDECWFLNNGGGALWFRLPYLYPNYLLRYSLTGTIIEGSVSPSVSAIAKHHNRLFIGGLDGGTATYDFWFEGTRFERVCDVWRETAPEYLFLSEDTKPFSTRNWVLWSQVNGGADDMPFYILMAMMGAFGNTAFDKVQELVWDAIEERKIGFLELPTDGQVMRLEPFGNDLLAYTTKGVYALTSTEDGYYAPSPLSRDVLASPGSLDATAGQHVYVSTKGFIHRLVHGQSPSVLDHRVLLGALTQSKIRVVRDPRLGIHFISDGTTGYGLVGDSLGGPLDLMPTCLDDKDGDLIGYAYDGGSGTRQIVAVTEPFDVNERGLKHVSTLQFGKDGLANCRAAVDYRYTGSTFARTPWTPVHPLGAAFVSASFADGRIAFKGDISDDDTGAELQRIEVRYNGEDMRFRRGTKGIPQAGEDDSG